MIPMRDGVKLHTEIYAPKNSAAPLPFLITRTPLWHQTTIETDSPRIFRLYQEMIPEGYIFVMQDIRGRYGSEGTVRDAAPVRDRERSKSHR